MRADAFDWLIVGALIGLAVLFAWWTYRRGFHDGEDSVMMRRRPPPQHPPRRRKL